MSVLILEKRTALEMVWGMKLFLRLKAGITRYGTTESVHGSGALGRTAHPYGIIKQVRGSKEVISWIMRKRARIQKTLHKDIQFKACKGLGDVVE